MGRIQELSGERERILAREGGHHTRDGDRVRVEKIDHDLRVLWDLRRRELAGEVVGLREDYYDRPPSAPAATRRGARGAV